MGMLNQPPEPYKEDYLPKKQKGVCSQLWPYLHLKPLPFCPLFPKGESAIIITFIVIMTLS